MHGMSILASNNVLLYKVEFASKQSLKEYNNYLIAIFNSHNIKKIIQLQIKVRLI